MIGLIVMVTVFLIFALVGFIGGFLVGLHETVGVLINIGAFVIVVFLLLWHLVTNPDVTTTKTNWEEFIMFVATIIVFLIAAFSWLVGKAVGEWITKKVK